MLVNFGLWWSFGNARRTLICRFLAVLVLSTGTEAILFFSFISLVEGLQHLVEQLIHSGILIINFMRVRVPSQIILNVSNGSYGSTGNAGIHCLSSCL